MLKLGHILTSHLVVTDLFIYSLSGLSLPNLAAPFYTEGVLDGMVYVAT